MNMGSGIRVTVAIAVAVAGTGVGFALGPNVDGLMVTLVAGIAAVLFAASTPDEALPVLRKSKPQAPAPLVEPRIDALIEAFQEPVLMTAGTRVACANRAARALLGQHIVGEDIRIAIRHPAAAERLVDLPEAEGSAPVHLVGLGTRDQRWEMRVRVLEGDRRLVQLVDETRQYATERMRVDFVANASHELRTPLASLLGFIETLMDEAGEDPDVRNRFLKIMSDEASRMRRLVDDLISLSRIEADKYRAPDKAVDFPSLVRDTCNELAAIKPDRGRDVEIVESSGAPVIGDEAQLSQLLHNIIGNAMKYGRPGTPVRIDLRTQGNMIELAVEDQGEGIAPEHLPRLTERFYRVDTGRSRSLGGTGLGLSIVKHIVERHRGRLNIASVPGAGTTVTVLLPAAPGRNVSEVMSSSRNATATGARAAGADLSGSRGD